MSKLLFCGIFALLIAACLGQTVSNPCLYSSASSQVLLPLNISASLCPSGPVNASMCMSIAYKYGNFQYNGPAGLKPNKGEIIMFLARYPDGSFHLVTMLNANVSTTMNVSMSMTGTAPANIELYDDPLTSTDTWFWNSTSNTGRFSWITLPGYTDGCIIGPITFVDNYCIKAVFNQPNNAIQKISVMSGTSSVPTRIITANYMSGSTFEFCQYPQTVTWKRDVTCPGLSNGAANISVGFGPAAVTYAWVNSTGATIGTSASISNLRAGQYYAYLTDTSTNHCNAARSVVITEPAALTATVTAVPFSCSANGSASVVVAGGSGGYTYAWKRMSTTIGTSSSVSGLAIGAYTVWITDSCGTSTVTAFSIGTTGCCGDGICQSNEMCTNGGTCLSDCGVCCPAGTMTIYDVVASSCKVCPAGSYNDAPGLSGCNSCPPNTFNAGGDDSCESCPDNTFSDANAGVCTPCPAGTKRGQDDTGCVTCGPGSVPDCDGTCTPCGPGSYAHDGWASCHACPAGTYATGGAGSCDTCQESTYAPAGSSSCTSCPFGTTSSLGSSHMLACRA